MMNGGLWPLFKTMVLVFAKLKIVGYNYKTFS